MNPTPGDVHVNRPLTDMSSAMIQEASNFIATQVFPTLPVDKQSDAYFTYDNAYWNRDEMTERAPGTESSGNGYKVGTDTYYAKVYAFHKDVDDQLRSNADSILNLDREATAYVTTKALIKREKTFVTNFMSSGIWTRDYAGVSANPSTNQVLQWNSSSSTPIEDVWDAKESILSKTGFEPNVLVLGYAVFKRLVNHPEIVERVKYSGANPVATIDLSELAQVFKIQKVVVMRGIENTAAENATVSHSFIGGGKSAGLFYAPPNPGLMTPSAGYHFTWRGYLGAGPDGNRIKRFRMEPLASDRIEIEMAFDPKKVSADLGAFWTTLVA